MQKEEIKEKIEELVSELVGTLKRELHYCIEGITLFGSYTIGKISLDRPNVDMLIFTKADISADDYLKIGEIFYRISKKYKEYFSVKIDSLPFRTGFPSGKKKLQLTLTPNILSMFQKNDKPPFGVPLNVLEGIVSTKKVVFGSDPLKEIDIKYTKQDVVQWAFFDVGILFRNQLIRAPLSYDVNEHLGLLADEALEIGKIALMWGTEIFLSEKDRQRGKHIDLIKNKEKMVSFYQEIDKELGRAAIIILEARTQFQKYKENKEKAFKLYNAAYTAITKVFFKILKEMEQ